MDIQAFTPVTLNFSKAALATGTTTTVSTTGTTTYAIRGKFYTKTAITNGATPTTDWATGQVFIPIPIPGASAVPNLPGVPNGALGYGCVFMVGFDHSGNIKVIQGQITALDINGNFITAPQFGGTGPAGQAQSSDNDFCPIGYFVVALGSTAVATWTFGTSNWNATGVTVTAQDVCGWVDRPQTS